MSTLSQFAPFAGGGLKSFQTGYVAADGTSSSGEDRWYVDVTVSAVTVAKSIPGFEGSFGGFDSYYSSSNAGMYARPQTSAYPGPTAVVTTRLTSTTNLRLANSAQGNPYKLQGRWKLAEAN